MEPIDATTPPPPISLADAACRDTPTDVFFAERVPGVANHGTEAKAICATCTERAACLAGAVIRGESAGIWGGAGDHRRRILRSALRRGEYDAVAAAHFRQLDGVATEADRAAIRWDGTPEAVRASLEPAPRRTCAKRGTFAAGCRCDRCRLMAQVPDAEARSIPTRAA